MARATIDSQERREGESASGTSNCPLPVEPIGTSGMLFTRVGLGTWAMGGLGPRMTWGDVDDEDSVATIRSAVEHGINWIDTAAMYGFGHSEEVVGDVLAGIPEADRPYVSTKCGLRWGLAEKTLRIGSPASLRWEVDESLRRLRLGRIDLYFVHWPAEDGTPIEEYWATLVEMRRQGKVRAVGLSNHDVGQLAAAESIGHVDVAQPPFSAIEREAADRLIPWCLEHNTAVFNYAPMQSGLLTGAFSEARVRTLPSNDWRKTHANFIGESLKRNVALADALRPIAEKHDSTVGAVAVAWTLAVPGVTAAIVGARRPSQVQSLVSAATLRLDVEDLESIAQAVETTGAGRGPVFSPGGMTAYDQLTDEA
jgi:aryl-alcohol dehydrogenase-like predicted oxidoreductase